MYYFSAKSFYGCTNLTNINIDKSVEIIDEDYNSTVTYTHYNNNSNETQTTTLNGEDNTCSAHKPNEAKQKEIKLNSTSDSEEIELENFDDDEDNDEKESIVARLSNARRRAEKFNDSNTTNKHSQNQKPQDKSCIIC